MIIHLHDERDSILKPGWMVICSPAMEGEGIYTAITRSCMGMPLCHVCKRHPEASAFLLAVEGGKQKQEKRSWLGSGNHRWAVGEAGKVESKEKRGFASIQNKQAQEQRKGREAGSPWRLPGQVN